MSPPKITSLTMSCKPNCVYQCWVPPNTIPRPPVPPIVVPGSLTISKTAVGGDGTFSFAIAPPASGVAFTTLTTVGGTASTTLTGVAPGSYVVTEGALTGWTGSGTQTVLVPTGGAGAVLFTNTALGTLVIDVTLPGDASGLFTFLLAPPAGGVTSVQIAVVNGFGTTSIEGVAAGAYTVTIVPTGGWSGPTSIDVSVPAGGSGEALFPLDQAGYLQLTKLALGGDGIFLFSITGLSGTAAASISTVGGLGLTSVSLPPGSYTVEEQPQSGWTAVTGSTGVVITQGVTSSATFTNQSISELVIEKITVGGDGSFLFDITGPTAFSAIVTTLNGTGSTGITLPSGSYTVTELAQTGWSGTTSLQVNAPGTATFTNTAIDTISIAKVAVGGDGTFEFLVGLSGSSEVQLISITTVNGTGATAAILPLGTYIVTEVAQTGWTSDTGTVVVVNPGTATFVNTVLSTLIIDKTAIGTSGLFTFDITGPTALTVVLAADGTGSASLSLPTGTYTVTEQGQSGWTILGSTSTTVVLPGTAAFDNVQLASITIEKIANGGTGIFVFAIAGGTVGIDTSVTGSVVVPDLLTGQTYTITEFVQSGWSGATTLSVVAPGTATFTNQAIGALSIVKTATGGDGTFVFDIIGVSGTASVAITTVAGTGFTTLTLPAGDYTVIEAAQPGWSGATSLFVTVPGTATFSNVAVGTLLINKIAVGSTGIFTFAVSTPDVSLTATIDTSIAGLTAIELPLGPVTVTEDPLTGWTGAVTLTGTIPTELSFTNVGLATLNIQKNATGPEGLFTFGVLGSLTGFTASVSTPSGAGSGTASFQVPVGEYIISEDSQTGWISVGVTSVALGLSFGASATVVFDNLALGDLFISKVATGSTAAASFVFSITGVTSLTATVDVANGTGSIILTDIPFGSYSILELGTSGWTAVGTTLLQIEVPGSVEFTNAALSQLTIEKSVTGGDGTFVFGIVPAAGGVTLASITTVGGTGSLTLTAGVGLYTIAEVAQVGFTALGVTAIIVASPGTASFLNSAVGDITINKEIALGGGDTAFTFTVATGGGGLTSVTLTTVGGTASLTLTGLPAQEYTITETPLPGWLTLPAAVTGIGGDVTFVNVPAGNLNITKVSDGATGIFTFNYASDVFTGSVLLTTSGTLGGGSATVSIPVAIGDFTVTELGQSGWTSTTPSQAITVTQGATGSLTFTNTALPAVVVNKFTTGADATFLFTVAPAIGGVTSFSITTTGSTGEFILAPAPDGLYTVTEVGPSGWTALNPSQTVNIAGNRGNLGFVNTQLNTITINKTAIGADTTFTFNLSPTAGGLTSATITTVNGTGSIVIPNVDAGTYTVTEVALTGWSGATAIDVAPDVGQGVTANFLNTQLNTLTVAKNTDIGGTFTFLLSPAIEGLTSITLDVAGTTGATSFFVPDGTYIVTEVPQVGWTATSPLTQTATVATGATATLTFSNIGSGVLNITKTLVEAPPGTTGNFLFQVTGPGIGSLSVTVPVTSGTSGSTAVTLPSGVYSVLESVQFGWTAIGPTLGTVVVEPLGTATIDFANSAVGAIVVTKVATGGTGSFTFNLLQGVTPIDTRTVAVDSSGTAVFFFSDLAPGAYDVVEVGQSGWTAPAGLTQTAVVVGLTSVGLTFENVLPPPATLVVTKTATGGGDTFTFNLSNGESGTISIDPPGGTGVFTFTGLSLGTYTVTETIPSFWTSLGPTSIDVTVTELGTGYSATFSNLFEPVLRINKTSVGGTGNFTFTVTPVPALVAFASSNNQIQDFSVSYWGPTSGVVQNSSGLFRAAPTRLPPGTYTMQASYSPRPGVLVFGSKRLVTIHSGSIANVVLPLP